MEIESCYITDIGIEKHTNQDSLLLKVVNTEIGKISFAVVCDGMGGLEKGELASAEVIRAFNDWFLSRLPILLREGFDATKLSDEWNSLIQFENERISQYGAQYGVNLGTTVVAFLLFPTQYYICNIGDSRVYELTNDKIRCVTKDQTFVQREIDVGRLTKEQAAVDERRSVLLQCVGASNVVIPDFYVGESRIDSTYLLCSDGFRHVVTEAEIHTYLNPKVVDSKEKMQENIKLLVELNKQRQERDNITAIVLKTTNDK